MQLYDPEENKVVIGKLTESDGMVGIMLDNGYFPATGFSCWAHLTNPGGHIAY